MFELVIKTNVLLLPCLYPMAIERGVKQAQSGHLFQISDYTNILRAIN